MQSSAQEVTMLFKLIAAAKDSWACFVYFEGSAKQVNLVGSMTKKKPGSWGPSACKWPLY